MAGFNLVAQIQLRSPTDARRVVEALQRQLGSLNVPVRIQANTRQIRAASTAIGLVDTESRRAINSTGELGRTLGIAARRFGAISIATGTFLALTRVIKNSIGDAIDFQRELNKITQTTGETGAAISAIRDRVQDLSSSLGVSSKELVVAARTLAQAGFSARSAAGSLEILSQTDLAATFNSIEDTTEGAIAILQQFGREAQIAGTEVEFLEKSLSAINSVSKAFAVESGDIIAAIRKTGGSFEAAGGNINELIALFTSVRATTRESADTIAVAFRTIFTRIQRTETIDALKALGIELQDAEGKFVGPLKAIEALSTGLSVLDTKDYRFVQIVEQLGGFRQIGKVIPLLKQFSITQDALNVAQQSSGSLAEDAATAQKSLAVQIIKVREEFNKMIEGFTESETFKSIASGALDFAKALIAVASAIKPLLPLVSAFAAIQIGKTLIPAIGAFSGVGRRATGGRIGFASGGEVPAMVMPGEYIFSQKEAQSIGYNKLNRMNTNPKRFATGGLVPGVGNRDSVPMSLEPGSFVLRKSSTKALGMDRQKFATGGKIENQNEVGIVIAELDNSARNVSKEVEITRAQLDTKRPGLGKQVITTGASKHYNVHKYGIDEKYQTGLAKSLRANLTDGLAQTINNTAESFAPEIDIKTPVILNDARVREQFNKTLGEGTVGALFETMLSSIENPAFNRGQDDQTRPFDFVNPLKRTLKLFPEGRGLENLKYVDAKATYDSVRGIHTKIVNQIAQENKGVERNPLDAQGKQKILNSLGSSKGINKNSLRDNLGIKVKGGDKVTEAIKNSLSSIGLEQDRDYRVEQYVYKMIEAQEKARGGPIQRFAVGGRVQRSVGYLDSDVLADPKNKDIVTPQMKALGIGKVSDYKKYLLGLAAQKRKSGQLRKLSAVFGVPGSGKSSIALGGGKSAISDQAKLRQTSRFPILTPADLERASEVIEASASIHAEDIGKYYKDVDKVTVLSSSTRSEQQEIRNRKKLRNAQISSGTDKTGFGRNAGTTDGAPLDSASIEALLLSELDPKKLAILGVGPQFSLKRKKGEELPEVVKKKIGLLYGAFAPATKGHASVLDEAKRLGISEKDFIAAVGIDTPVKAGDEHSQRTAVFNQDFRAGLAAKAFQGANISKVTKDAGFGVPEVFDVGTSETGRRRFIKPDAGSLAFYAEKDPSSLIKYVKAGLIPTELSRDSSAVSGTLARNAALSGDLATLEGLVNPAVFDTLSKNSSRLKNRSDALPKIFDRVDRKTKSLLEVVQLELDKYPARLTPQIKAAHPEYEAIVTELRKKRDKIKDRAGSKPAKYLGKLAKFFPQKYGLEFADGGTVPAMVMPGERIFSKNQAQGIGYDTLDKMNAGGVVPGTGNRDSVFTMLEAGGYVLNKTANKKMQKYANGGVVQHFSNGSPNGVKASSGSLKGILDKVYRLFSKKPIPDTVEVKVKPVADGYLGTGVGPNREPIRSVSRSDQEIRKRNLIAEKRKDFRNKTSISDRKAIKGLISGVEEGKISASSKGLATNFLFMGGAVASLIPQLGLFSDATADAATQAAVAATSLYGIGGSVLDGLSVPIGKFDTKLAGIGGKFGGFVAKAGGLSTALPSILAGVSAGVAITQYASSKTKAEATVSDKKAKEELKQTSETGKGSLDSVTNNMLKAANLQLKASQQSDRGIKGAVGGAVTGAAIGAFFGPIGVAIGGLAGGIIGSLGGLSTVSENAKIKNPEIRFIQESAKAQFTAAKATYDFADALNKAKEQGLEGADYLKLLGDETQKLNEEFVKTRAAATTAEINSLQTDERGVFGKLFGTDRNYKSEETKAILEANKASVAEVAAKKTEAARNLRAETLTQVGKNLSEAKGPTSPTASFSGVENQVKQYAEALLSNRDLTTEDIIKDLSNFKEQIRQSTEVSNKNKEAEQSAIAIRLSEIAIIERTTAALSAMTQSSRDFARSQSNISRTIASASGGFEFSTPDFSNVFSDLSRVGNFSEFSNITKSIAKPLGKAGSEVANEVIVIADSIRRLKGGLTTDAGQRAKILDTPAGKKTFDGFIGGILGEANFAGLSEDLRAQLFEQFKTAGGAAGFDQDKIEKFIKAVEDSGSSLTSILNEAASLSKQYLSDYNTATLSIIASINAERDARISLVDVQELGVNRLQQAFAGNITESQFSQGIAQKELFRNQKAQVGVADIGIQAGSVSAASGALVAINKLIRDNNEQLKNETDTDKLRILNTANANLSDQAKRATKELERLADQSDRASDVLSQIDKERAKRDFVSGQVEDFILGTGEQRKSQLTTFRGANVVARTGSFQGLPEELRKSVGDLLKSIAEVEPGGVADNVRRNAIRNDAIRAGVRPDIAAKIANRSATTKEERLINDLKALNQVEASARLALLAVQQENTLSINNLLPQIDATLKAIETNFNFAKAEQEKVKAEREALLKADVTAETPEAKKTREEVELKDRLANFGVESQKLLDEIQSKIAAGVAEKAVATGTAMGDAMAKAYINGVSGGPTKPKESYIPPYQLAFGGGNTYRAEGGSINSSIFQPKGTDTVPAMLTPGEYVVKKSAVDHYGRGTLDKLNNKTLYAYDGAFVGKKRKEDETIFTDIELQTQKTARAIDASQRSVDFSNLGLTEAQAKKAVGSYQQSVDFSNLGLTEAQAKEAMNSYQIADSLSAFEPTQAEKDEINRKSKQEKDRTAAYNKKITESTQRSKSRDANNAKILLDRDINSRVKQAEAGEKFTEYDNFTRTTLARRDEYLRQLNDAKVDAATKDIMSKKIHDSINVELLTKKTELQIPKGYSTSNEGVTQNTLKTAQNVRKNALDRKNERQNQQQPQIQQAQKIQKITTLPAPLTALNGTQLLSPQGFNELSNRYQNLQNLSYSNTPAQMKKDLSQLLADVNVNYAQVQDQRLNIYKAIVSKHLDYYSKLDANKSNQDNRSDLIRGHDAQKRTHLGYNSGSYEERKKQSIANRKALYQKNKGVSLGASNVGGFAMGGNVPYDGSLMPKGSDTIPAMLSKGEYVIRKSAVDHYGSNFMDSVNNKSMGGPIYRANGGPVSQANGGNISNGSSLAGLDASALTPMFDGFISSFKGVLDGLINVLPKNISDSMQGLTKSLNNLSAGLNMTMTHTVNVDGLITLGGLNIQSIAGQLTDAIGELVASEVQKALKGPPKVSPSGARR